MTQPEELKTDWPLKWSTGRGTDVWALFLACVAGDLKAVGQLLQKDPSLARAHHAYRKPLYFAVRENRLKIVDVLLDHDPDPTGLASSTTCWPEALIWMRNGRRRHDPSIDSNPFDTRSAETRSRRRCS